MADTKLSALTAVATPSRTTDKILCVNTADTTTAPAGSGGSDQLLTIAQILSVIQASDIPALNYSPVPSATSGQALYSASGVPTGMAGLSAGSSGEPVLTPIAAPGTPSAGSLYADSTRLASASYLGGQWGYIPRSLYSQVANTTNSGATAFNHISTTGATGTNVLAAGLLNVPGKILRVRASGYMSSTGGAPPNLYPYLQLGTTVVATSTAAAPATTALSGVPWSMDVDVVAKTSGTTGTLDTYGMMLINAGGVNATAFRMANASAAGSTQIGTPVTIDLTQSLTIGFYSVWASTTNSPTFTVASFSVEERF